jgi:hypothetical protein
MGLLLQTQVDAIPGSRDAFLVVDSSLLVQAISREAEGLLALTEAEAVNRPVAELLVSADTEARGRTSFAGSLAEAAAGREVQSGSYVRPWNTFGVRMRARVSPCGPTPAALVVLDSALPGLRPVGG